MQHYKLTSFHVLYCFVSIAVSDDANFILSSTRLTIGGFTQAGVARNLIDMPSNSEKGLSHRFVWLFPKPIFGKFAALEEVDETFTSTICMFSSTLLCTYSN